MISLNISGLEKNKGFQLTLPLLRQAMAALVYGDLLMLLSNQVKPYETEKGQAMAMVETWSQRLVQQFEKKSGYGKKEIAQNMGEIVRDFARIPVQMTPKVKVGVVGEIYVKYSKLGNNDLEGLLYREDCEVMIPGVLNFVMYCIENNITDVELYGGSPIKAMVAKKIMDYLCSIENIRPWRSHSGNTKEPATISSCWTDAADHSTRSVKRYVPCATVTSESGRTD